jgi:hypothetical protein
MVGIETQCDHKTAEPPSRPIQPEKTRARVCLREGCGAKLNPSGPREGGPEFFATPVKMKYKK